MKQLIEKHKSVSLSVDAGQLPLQSIEHPPVWQRGAREGALQGVHLLHVEVVDGIAATVVSLHIYHVPSFPGTSYSGHRTQVSPPIFTYSEPAVSRCPEMV